LNKLSTQKQKDIETTASRKPLFHESLIKSPKIKLKQSAKNTLPKARYFLVVYYFLAPD
jgi:hypothetical protein